jgi:hypothetical protein
MLWRAFPFFLFSTVTFAECLHIDTTIHYTDLFGSSPECFTSSVKNDSGGWLTLEIQQSPFWTPTVAPDAQTAPDELAGIPGTYYYSFYLPNGSWSTLYSSISEATAAAAAVWVSSGLTSATSPALTGTPDYSYNTTTYPPGFYSPLSAGLGRYTGTFTYFNGNASVRWKLNTNYVYRYSYSCPYGYSYKVGDYTKCTKSANFAGSSDGYCAVLWSDSTGYTKNVFDPDCVGLNASYQVISQGFEFNAYDELTVESPPFLVTVSRDATKAKVSVESQQSPGITKKTTAETAFPTPQTPAPPITSQSSGSKEGSVPSPGQGYASTPNIPKVDPVGGCGGPTQPPCQVAAQPGFLDSILLKINEVVEAVTGINSGWGDPPPEQTDSFDFSNQPAGTEETVLHYAHTASTGYKNKIASMGTFRERPAAVCPIQSYSFDMPSIGSQVSQPLSGDTQYICDFLEETEVMGTSLKEFFGNLMTFVFFLTAVFIVLSA